MSALFHNTHLAAEAVLIRLLREVLPCRTPEMVEPMGKLLEENQ
jgi:hypothetical protein